MQVAHRAVITLVMVLAFTSAASGQEEQAAEEADGSTAADLATPTPTWLAEQTCVDPTFRMPMSATGRTKGELLHCARALGLRKRDPDFAAYDFRLHRRTDSRERWTERCDAGGLHIGSRYHASGSDRVSRAERPEHALTGTFDYTVVRELLDPGTETWQVREQGIVWDLHDAAGAPRLTWSVDIGWMSEGEPDEPSLTALRGVEPSEFARIVCEALR